MRGTLKFIVVLAVSLLVMLAFRALVATIYTVEGDGLEPVFQAGDRVVVNRWSYGLRTGGSGLFDYGRLWRQPMERGDIIAYDDPTDEQHGRVLLGKLRGLPGDTITMGGQVLLLPSIRNCAEADYYWVQALGPNNTTDSRTLGPVPERCIIGRAAIIVYSHQPGQPFWRGYHFNRMLLVP